MDTKEKQNLRELIIYLIAEAFAYRAAAGILKEDSQEQKDLLEWAKSSEDKAYGIIRRLEYIKENDCLKQLEKLFVGDKNDD